MDIYTWFKDNVKDLPNEDIDTVLINRYHYLVTDGSEDIETSDMILDSITVDDVMRALFDEIEDEGDDIKLLVKSIERHL